MDSSHAGQLVQKYMHEGKWAESEKLCRQILAVEPGSGAAWGNLGISLYRLGRKPDAAAAFCEAAKYQPGSIEIIRFAALALLESGPATEAIQYFRKVTQITPQPRAGEAFYDLGVALAIANQTNEAIDAYRQSLAIEPSNALAWNNLGNLLKRSGQVDHAVDALRQAVRLKRNWGDAHCNLGGAYLAQGAIDSANEAFDRALKHAPEHAAIHYNHGVLLLLQGDFDRGWPEYEWRWECDEVHMPTRFTTPPWRGEDLDGKTILLHAEQGLGDTIQFVRYVPMVAQRGGRVFLCVQPEAVRLVKDIPGVEQIASHPKHLPPCQTHCYLMDLPHGFKTRLDSIPGRVPYIHVSQPKNFAAGFGLKVGLAWAGRPTHVNNAFRSISLSLFSALLDVPGATFYSLQKGPGSEQAAGTKLIDMTGQITDLADTAALVSQLDLVITVDSAVAHLAGAMGKPVWILLPFVPDWRWMLGREDSPWYPTARLFRQLKLGDWNSVIERVMVELAAFGKTVVRDDAR